MAGEGGASWLLVRPPPDKKRGSPSLPEPGRAVKLRESHNALVIPLIDGYAVSCSCGWVGEDHEAPGPAEQEARDHEADPTDAQEGGALRGTGGAHRDQL